MRRSLHLTAAPALLALALSACQSGAPAPATGKSAALRNMEAVATAAHRCWFASKDATFASYSFANELNSFSGQPRFLLVPKGNFGGRPLRVVQAQGPAGQVTAFGPLLEGEHGARISADIRRWAGGDTGCGSTA